VNKVKASDILFGSEQISVEKYDSDSIEGLDPSLSDALVSLYQNLCMQTFMSIERDGLSSTNVMRATMITLSDAQKAILTENFTAEKLLMICQLTIKTFVAGMSLLDLQKSKETDHESEEN